MHRELPWLKTTETERSSFWGLVTRTTVPLVGFQSCRDETAGEERRREPHFAHDSGISAPAGSNTALLLPEPFCGQRGVPLACYQGGPDKANVRVRDTLLTCRPG